MVVPYAVEGDSFHADKPRLWTNTRFVARSRNYRDFDVHPDGQRLAVQALPEDQAAVKQDKVVFVYNFFDELRRIAPAGK